MAGRSFVGPIPRSGARDTLMSGRRFLFLRRRSSFTITSRRWTCASIRSVRRSMASLLGELHYPPLPRFSPNNFREGRDLDQGSCFPCSRLPCRRSTKTSAFRLWSSTTEKSGTVRALFHSQTLRSWSDRVKLPRRSSLARQEDQQDPLARLHHRIGPHYPAYAQVFATGKARSSYVLLSPRPCCQSC